MNFSLFLPPNWLAMLVLLVVSSRLMRMVTKCIFRREICSIKHQLIHGGLLRINGIMLEDQIIQIIKLAIPIMIFIIGQLQVITVIMVTMQMHWCFLPNILSINIYLTIVGMVVPSAWWVILSNNPLTIYSAKQCGNSVSLPTMVHAPLILPAAEPAGRKTKPC